jgi:hypothetical protein
MAAPPFISNNYSQSLKEDLKTAIFNALKGDASEDPVEIPVYNAETGETSIEVDNDPLKEIRETANQLSDAIDDYISERIYVEIIGHSVETGVLVVTPGGTTASKLKNVN